MSKLNLDRIMLVKRPGSPTTWIGFKTRDGKIDVRQYQSIRDVFVVADDPNVTHYTGQFPAETYEVAIQEATTRLTPTYTEPEV